MTPPETEMKAQDFASDVFPTWCPGCGDFGVLNGLRKAMAELSLQPHDVAVISGIGCSSNLPHFLNTYGFHTIHGRLLPVAMGTKLANPDLTVVGTGGDGDGYGIGSGHFTHACRRNQDLTYIVMDNQIYGLTTGQTSPTSEEGHETKSTPEGNIEPPYRPIATALAQGATYVARGFSGDAKNLAHLVAEGIRHEGFALIDVFSPCVTFNKRNTYGWFREHLVNLQDPGEDSGLEAPHDPSDLTRAFDLATWEDPLPYGLFYQAEGKSTYEQRDPTLSRGHNPVRDVAPRDVEELVRGFE